MSAYYNEIDKFKAAWLRELIKRNLIADGEVDERSIKEVCPTDLKGFSQCHFFAGIGVWSYALRQAGWSDNRPVWTGSCPCQSFSQAGKRKGFQDERHLWPDWYRLVAECRPGVIFGEQSASKDALAWLDLVQSNLEVSDYTSAALDICAAGFGAPHIRQRLYFVAADANGPGLSIRDEPSLPRDPQITSAWSEFERVHAAGAWKEREAKSPVRVFTNGSPARVGRLRGYGDAIVAEVAKEFIQAYMKTEG